MGTWTNSAYKIISITSGTDTTNPDLIAWLSQNATLQQPIPPTPSEDKVMFGSDSVDKMYFGEDEIIKLYLGTNLLFQSQDIPPVQLISFSIEGTTYQAEQGMNWSQWVASEYNTDGYIDEINYITNSTGRMVNYYGISVDPFDSIIADEHYALGSND